MEGSLKITVKWSGKEYEFELDENNTVAELKGMIHKETGVRPDRQKLLNLKLKGSSFLWETVGDSIVFLSHQANRRRTSAGWAT